MTVRLSIGRPLPGTVGETQRVSHLFPAELDAPTPARPVAYCGAEFDAADLEWLDGPVGMPCVRCLRYAPSPDAPELPAGS